MSRAKPHPGHKLARVAHAFVAYCECGWSSGTWMTQGARANAIGEWHQHIETCKQREARNAPET